MEKDFDSNSQNNRLTRRSNSLQSNRLTSRSQSLASVGSESSNQQDSEPRKIAKAKRRTTEERNQITNRDLNVNYSDDEEESGKHYFDIVDL